MRNAICLSIVLALAGRAAAQQPEPVPPAPPAEQPPATTPEPPPVEPPAVVSAPKPAEPDPKPEDPPPGKKLAVGTKGLLNVGLLAQGWYQHERAGDATQISQFRIRRAEISVNGEILPKRVGYRVMFDPARVLDTQAKVTVVDAAGNTVTINNDARVSVLQDFFITALTPWAEVSVGQFKIPISWEGYNSSGKLAFVERDVVSSTFGDRRDIGLRATKAFSKWMYSAGLYNGTGQDNPDTNVQKDIALRLEAYPVKGLTIAGVTYDSLGIRNRAGTKDRWEADVRYEHGPLLVQGEVIFAHDVAKDNEDPIKAHGFYALAGYSFPDVDKTFHGVLQPVVRFGMFEPNGDVDDDELTHFDVGANYYLQKHEMKLQLAYSRVQFKADMKDANNQVLLAAQVSY